MLTPGADGGDLHITLQGDFGAILEWTRNGHKKDSDRHPRLGNVGLGGSRGVVKHALLTPRNPARSLGYRADRHRTRAPINTKCCELDVPIMMQVGHSLVYQRERRMRSVGRPICLDQVACDFPELKLLGIHIGIPWTDEMISMAWKHEHVYIGVDAYAPRYWPPQLVHYLNTYGRHKVLFGTDWPVIDPERAVAEIAELDLRPEAYRALMRENALRVFRLPQVAADGG